MGTFLIKNFPSSIREFMYFAYLNPVPAFHNNKPSANTVEKYIFFFFPFTNIVTATLCEEILITSAFFEMWKILQNEMKRTYARARVFVRVHTE